MKTRTHFLKLPGIALLCGIILLSCKKNNNLETNEDPQAQAGTFTVEELDNFSDHLQFFNAVKKQGTIPQGPVSSSLKISFKDTLHLLDKIKRPIKFLHEDTTKNVAGVYVQVHASTNATYYYDVPEIPEMADNDSVSVIMIGIDPEGLTDPAGVPPAGAPSPIRITIVPYDENGQPLAQADGPVEVSDPKVDPNGTCGLVLPQGDYWDWEMSYIANPDPNGDPLFLNSPEKIWGANGQNIKGCCINNISSYNINCSGNTAAQRSLRFNTFFTYVEEIFKFFDNGTYIRLTGQFSAIPEPQESDFCGSGPGVVTDKLSNVTYEGNWTINRLASPVEGDSLHLTLQGTKSTGGGYGNPGGRIRILDCYLLVMIQPDNEGSGRDLVKFYNNRRVNSPYWNPLDFN